MRIFGWIYIIIFSINAVLVLADAVTPGTSFIRIITGVTGIVIIILSIVAFILACMGRFRPRKVFLFLSGYYLLTVIYGIVMGILLVMKVGVEKVMSGSTPDLLQETFTWLVPVGWVLNIATLLLAVYGIIGYLKKPVEGE